MKILPSHFVTFMFGIDFGLIGYCLWKNGHTQAAPLAVIMLIATVIAMIIVFAEES